jgi:hypothetical protein
MQTGSVPYMRWVERWTSRVIVSSNITLLPHSAQKAYPTSVPVKLEQFLARACLHTASSLGLTQARHVCGLALGMGYMAAHHIRSLPRGHTLCYRLRYFVSEGQDYVKKKNLFQVVLETSVMRCGVLLDSGFCGGIRYGSLRRPLQTPNQKSSCEKAIRSNSRDA